MKLVDPGRFRHRIDVERPAAATQGELGDAAPTWETLYSNIPCDVDSLGGGELFRARQVHAESTDQVTMWYAADIDTQCRFVEHAVEGDRYLYPVSETHDGNHRQKQFICKQRDNN